MTAGTESSLSYVLWAIAGAGIVLLGLFVELFAEKERFNSVKSFRRWKTAKKWGGEIVVIIGIVVEMVVGGIYAFREWQNDPMNQPVTSLRAILYLNVEGTNFDRFWINFESNGNWAWLHNPQHNADGELEASNRRIAAFLGCDSYEMNPLILSNGTISFMYSIGLSWPSPDPMVAQAETPPMVGHTTLLVLQQPPPTVRELEKELTGLTVRVLGVATNGMSFATQSSCVLIINEKTQIHFAMPTNISGNGYTFFPVALKEMQK